MIEAGARGFILKDSDIEELTRAIRPVHAGGTYFSQDILYHVLRNIRDVEKPKDPVPSLSPREQAFLTILKENLGKDSLTDPRHTTCTGIAYHVDLTRLETTMMVIARQFALMNEAGYENMVISCVTSFGLYNEVLELWEHHPELEARIRDYLTAPPERRMCCGFGFRQYFIPSNRGYSLSCMYRKMKALEPCHPDLILTNCPGCKLFFDRWQNLRSRKS
jgi:heterodisulfide reductase subunit B